MVFLPDPFGGYAGDQNDDDYEGADSFKLSRNEILTRS